MDIDWRIIDSKFGDDFRPYLVQAFVKESQPRVNVRDKGAFFYKSNEHLSPEHHVIELLVALVTGTLETLKKYPLSTHSHHAHRKRMSNLPENQREQWRQWLQWWVPL